MTMNAPCLTLLPMVEKANKHQDFANRLTEEMRRQRRSVKDLSQACDVTYEMARRYTLGTAKPRDEKLQKIADWLNVQAADRKSTRLNSSHVKRSRMPSSA